MIKCDSLFNGSNNGRLFDMGNGARRANGHRDYFLDETRYQRNLKKKSNGKIGLDGAINPDRVCDFIYYFFSINGLKYD